MRLYFSLLVHTLWAAFVVKPSTATLKDVFAHYMIGTMSAEQAIVDVQQAKAINIDAFALNVQNTVDPWAVDSIRFIFDAATNNDFKLFFSFDMAARSEVSYFLDTFVRYSTSPAYYRHNNLPVISTFYGARLTFGSPTPNEGWQRQLKDALRARGIEVYFLPAFSDAPNGPTNFFSTYPVVDGVFSWDSAWPYEDEGNVNVSSTADNSYLSEARNAGKTFMMGISPLQFKHIDGGQNWYRKGELNMALRIGQILDVAPDFVEIITWNDAGESHNIGNCWPESISGSPIPGYTDGYDHSGWQKLIPPMISAFKSGVRDITAVTPLEGRVSGAFWYRPLLVSKATCPGDPLGKPRGAANAEDSVNIALFMAEAGNVVTVSSGGSQIASYSAAKGLNSFFVPGLKAGRVGLEVTSSSGTLVASASSIVDVVEDTNGICNFNYQVVAVAA